jgi:hypothetical protein
VYLSLENSEAVQNGQEIDVDYVDAAEKLLYGILYLLWDHDWLPAVVLCGQKVLNFNTLCLICNLIFFPNIITLFTASDRLPCYRFITLQVHYYIIQGVSLPISLIDGWSAPSKFNILVDRSPR